LLAILISFASLVASGIFCWLGVSYLAMAEREPILLIAGVLTLLYGIASVAFLGAAWLRPAVFLQSLSRWSAVALLALWIAGSLDSGRVSGHEAWAIVGAVFLLALNLAGVQLVLKTHSAAQQCFQPDAVRRRTVS
jgi:hypothetical protein